MGRGRDACAGYANGSRNGLGGYFGGFLTVLFRCPGSGQQQAIRGFQVVAALQGNGYLALVFRIANQHIHGTGYGPGSTQSVNLGTAFITGNYRDIFGIHRIAGKLQIRKATLADLAIGSGQGQRAAEGTLLDFQLGKTALIGGNGNITGIGRYGRVTDFTYGIACHIQHGHRAADGRTAPCRSDYALHLGIGLGVCLKGHIPSRIQSAAHNRNAGGRILLLCCHGHGVTGIGDIFPVTIHHAMGFFFREVASLHRIVYILEDIADVHLGLAVTGIIGRGNILAHICHHDIEAHGRTTYGGIARSLPDVLVVAGSGIDGSGVDFAVFDIHIGGAVQLVDGNAHAYTGCPGGAHTGLLIQGQLVVGRDIGILRPLAAIANGAVLELGLGGAVRF